MSQGLSKQQSDSAVEFPSASGEEGLSREVAFEILSTERRRHVLRYLAETEGSVELGVLAEQVAAAENGIDPPDVDSDQRMRAYTALRQSHLPKMDRRGVVEFDADRGTVTPTPRVKDLEPYLRIRPHDESWWCNVYLGIGILTELVLTALVLAGVGRAPPWLLLGVGWGSLAMLSLTIIALMHFVRVRGLRLDGSRD